MKLIRIFRWLFINSLLAYLAYDAVFNGNDGSARLYQFYVWIGHTSLFITAFNDELRAKALKRNSTPPVPLWINNALDSFLCAIFIYHGWWMTAIATMLSPIAAEKLYKKEDE